MFLHLKKFNFKGPKENVFITAIEFLDEGSHGTADELIGRLADGRRLSRPLFLVEHFGQPQNLAVANESVAIQSPVFV